MRQKKAQFTVFRNVPASLVFEFTFLLSYYGNSVGETTGILQYPRVIIRREQFLPSGLRKLVEEHFWRLQGEAAVQKGVLLYPFSWGMMLGGTGGNKCLTCLCLMPPLSHWNPEKTRGPTGMVQVEGPQDGYRDGWRRYEGDMRDTQNTFFPLWSFFISVAIHWVLTMGINYTRNFISIIEFNSSKQSYGIDKIVLDVRNSRRLVWKAISLSGHSLYLWDKQTK